MITPQNGPQSRDDLTPPGVAGWCIWSDGKRGWASGTGTAAISSIHRTNSQQPVVRYTGPDGNGNEVTAELRLDSPAPDCWELWLVSTDESGRETGYDELLAWCSWPDTTPADVAAFLIPLHREGFQRKRTETELAATKILREHLGGTGHLLQSDDSDDEE